MSFDRLAPHYRWMEWLLAGGKLHRCRTAYLGEITAPRRALLLGEGHGRALVECRQRFPKCQITCLDASAAMLAQARRSLEREGLDSGCVDFVHGDILEWTAPAGTYDLVVANFFFDCFRAEQLESLMPRIRSATTAGANWLIADFHLPASGWRRTRCRVLLWTMYTFFRTFTRIPASHLVSTTAMLEREGLSLHRRAEFDWGLLKSEWWIRRP